MTRLLLSLIICGKKWNIVNDTGNVIIYNTEILKFNLCDYNNAYIPVRGDITVVAVRATQAAFTNCIPFTKSITKIDKQQR